MDIRVPFDQATLAQALLNAYAGDTIWVESTYDASAEGAMYIGQSLTIAGKNGRAKLPALAVLGTPTLTLRDVEVAGSTNGEGGTWSIGQVGGGLVLDDVIFTAKRGRAISAAYTWVEANDVVIDGFRDAPAVYLYSADARFSGGTYTNNERNVFLAVDSSLVVSSASFSGNSALSDTANDAIFEHLPAGADVLALRSSVFLASTTHQGSAADYGGAVFSVEGILQVQGSTFLETTASMVGGAVGVGRDDSDGDGLEDGPAPQFSIVETTFTGTSAGAGGAVALLDGYGQLLRVTFTDTHAVPTPAYGDAEGDLVGGGAVGAYNAFIYAEDVTVDGATARDGGGAMVFSETEAYFWGLTVENASAPYGGAVLASASSFGSDGAHLEGNSADVVGGAIFALSPVAMVLQHAMICANDAPEGAAIGVARGSPQILELRNSRFVQNTGGAAVGIFADEVTSAGSPFVAENVTFVDNDAALEAHDGAVEVVNALVVGGEKGVVANGATVSVAYSGFYDVGGVLDGVTRGDGILEEADPKFEAVGCDATLWLGAGSVARDAGDPALLDPDGTRSDMGAWGGPDSRLPDADGDGHVVGVDCDDADADVFPGAVDAWYDGTDGDCAGGDDFDQDGDGFALGNGDCDDLDPARNPDAVEIENDRMDQDCDGIDNGHWEWVSSRGGCATTPGGGLGAVLIAGLFVRRRAGKGCPPASS